MVEKPTVDDGLRYQVDPDGQVGRLYQGEKAHGPGFTFKRSKGAGPDRVEFWNTLRARNFEVTIPGTDTVPTDRVIVLGPTAVDSLFGRRFERRIHLGRGLAAAFA